MFAERLKTLRLEAKLTQKEISNKLGISQPTYQRYEKSEREPNQEMLQKISSLFNVTIDYLFGNTDNRNTSNIDDDLEKLVSSEFMSSYLDTNYYYFYNNASLDKIFMKRYGEITRDSIGKWTSSSGGGSSGGGGGFSGGGSSSSGGGGSGGGRRSILKYLI